MNHKMAKKERKINKKNNPENTQILCRGCAAYGECKLTKKGTALQCRNFWEHIPTSVFLKAIENNEIKK